MRKNIEKLEIGEHGLKSTFEQKDKVLDSHKETVSASVEEITENIEESGVFSEKSKVYKGGTAQAATKKSVKRDFTFINESELKVVVSETIEAIEKEIHKMTEQILKLNKSAKNYSELNEKIKRVRSLNSVLELLKNASVAMKDFVLEKWREFVKVTK